MKKILIATSALAFAGSAFAADVSGYVISAYAKDNKNKSLYNETEVYFSGSKTASNGLTFGATYTLGFFGNSAKAQGKTLVGSIASLASTTAVVTHSTITKSVIDSVTLTPNTPSVGSPSQYATVNAFVSGSFGKVELGKHNVASRQIGTASIAAGAGAIQSLGDATRVATDAGITYTSPMFAGAQIAYTTEPGDNKASSVAAKYATTVSGLGIAVAYGTYTPAVASELKKSTAQGIKISKAGFSVSYSTSKTAGAVPAASVLTGADNSYNRIGLGYSANRVTVGYAQGKTGGVKGSNIYAGYDVASGLTVFVESYKVSGHKVTTNNTKTTWIGTNISF